MPKKRAGCHPDRPHFYRGLCRACYRGPVADLERTPRNLPEPQSPAQPGEVCEPVAQGREVRDLLELHPESSEPLPDGLLPDQSERVVPKVRTNIRTSWIYDFRDCVGTVAYHSVANHYYKSECRPLKELKPFHTDARRRGYYEHTFRQWLDFRDKARKDLYYLGKYCIGSEMSGAGFVEHVHREMCAMFVQKNFDGVYHKGYTLSEVRDAIDRQKREKEMLLLAPRGAYKSTVNKVDCAQWMLNCPDVRILIMTGASNLADKFLKEVKGFFYQPDKVGPTYFQKLFPEYIIRGKDGVSSTDLICPARICRQEGNPTLWVNSIGGVLAGWHCDVMKGDDIVNEDNSNNDDTRDALKSRYDNVSQNLPDEWAFRDHLGTRYMLEDWYGERLRDAEKYKETNAIKFLQRAAWTVKPGYEHIPLKLLEEHMVDLYFPEKLSFRSLMAKCRNNETNFRCFPASSKVLMADWTEKSIEEIKPGDLVVGFGPKGLVECRVTHTHSKRDYLIRAITDAGREILTTKEHEFLRPINAQRKEYGPLRVGARVCSVYRPCEQFLSSEAQRTFDWLGGILDGEGSVGSGIILNQSESCNPEVHEAIREALRFLGIEFSECVPMDRTVTSFMLLGGRSLKMRFLKHSRLAKRARLLASLWGSARYIAESSGRRGGSSHEKVIFIESLNEQNVYDLTTTTSNYVCQGFAVHNCQQLNEPAGGDVALNFPLDVLEGHKILLTRVPYPSPGLARKIMITWDTAHNDSMASDYSAGAAGYCHDQTRTLYVMEIRAGKWKDSDLADQVIDLHFNWKAAVSVLEKFPGWELLAAEIQRKAFKKFGKTIAISWREVDNASNAKRNRVKGLEVLLADHRLYFVDGDWLDLTFQQFTRFTGFSKKRKDDIPDAISFLQRMIPAEQRPAEETRESEHERKAREAAEMKERFERQHQDSAYSTLFQSPPAPPAPEPEPSDPGPARMFGGLLHL